MIAFLRSIPSIVRLPVALALILGAGPAIASGETDWFPALITAAREQIGVTVAYDPAYRTIPYPDGDVPPDRGVCTDVIIRALRRAHRIDLQKLVHTDMHARFAEYPRNWHLTRPDPNIDHRRVPNLQTFLRKHALVIDDIVHVEAFLPGDLVTSMLPGNLPHIMIVSDQKAHDGTPLVIHNIGRGTQEEDYLFRYPMTAHYRLDPATLIRLQRQSP